MHQLMLVMCEGTFISFSTFIFAILKFDIVIVFYPTVLLLYTTFGYLIVLLLLI